MPGNVVLTLTMQIEDLSCLETTVFDRAFDNDCTTDAEAQSQLLTSQFGSPQTYGSGDHITALIRCEH